MVRQSGSRWLATARLGGYHEFPDYGIIELIRVEGRTDRRRLSGTPLHNWGFPLFRYRTGDEVGPCQLGQCSCGRAFRLLEKIDGRVEDGQVLPLPHTVVKNLVVLR
jgi:phenylacetate-CoA ligase